MSSTFVQQFIEQGGARSTDRLPTWWKEFRSSALKKLETLEVPTRKDEEWKFLKLKTLARSSFVAESDATLSLSREEIASRLLPESSASTLVFLNGRFSSELSRVDELPDDVVLTNWQGLLDQDPGLVRDYVGANDFWKDDLFYNLNGANFEDGAVVLIPRNTVLEKPLHILYVGSGKEGSYASHPRNIIVAGENAEATVVEEYDGRDSGAYFHNVVNEISVGANATVKHFKVQRDSTDAFHIARNLITVAQDACYDATAINLGASVSRNDSYARFEGQNIDCTLDGLVHIRGNQTSDTHTALDHAQPNSRSFQLHKVIVDEGAHSIFNGKILVRKDAQKTSSNQLNQNLLLSNKAHIDTKPQLEILADDVICSHGATVGQLSEDQFFYLMSRGIEREHARALLTYAFAAEVLETITVESLRKALEAEVLAATVG